MTENSFLYAGDLESEMLEIRKLDENSNELDQERTFSVGCASFFTIFCC